MEEGGGWSTCVVTYSFNLLNNPTTVLLNWLKLEYYKDRLAIFQLINCLHNIDILSHSVCFTIEPQHLHPHFPKIDLLNAMDLGPEWPLQNQASSFHHACVSTWLSSLQKPDPCPHIRHPSKDCVARHPPLLF